jgi:hypothetical protein
MRSIPILTTALLLLAGPGRAADPTPDEIARMIATSPEGQSASRLIRLLRSDEVAQGVSRHLSRTLRGKDRIDDQQLACLDELTVEDFNLVYSVVVMEGYDLAEVDYAYEFYTSAIGARFMRMIHEKSWRTNPRDFPLPPDRPKEGLTMPQWQEVGEFKNSLLGARFADPRAITQSEAGLKASATLWMAKAIQCGVPEDVVRGQVP